MVIATKLWLEYHFFKEPYQILVSVKPIYLSMQKHTDWTLLHQQRTLVDTV